MATELKHINCLHLSALRCGMAKLQHAKTTLNEDTKV
jgi:hypothetical protein